MEFDITQIGLIFAWIWPPTALVLGAIWWLYQHDKERRTELSRQLSEMRGQLQKNYADKILDKRLEVYPYLYFILSDFQKLLYSETVSMSHIKQLLSDIDAWDSRYAIFFSARSGVSCYRLRKLLSQVINTPEQTSKGDAILEENVDDLRYKVRELELLLKSDIGIYIREVAQAVREIDSYGDLNREVDNTVERQRHRSAPTGRSQNPN